MPLYLKNRNLTFHFTGALAQDNAKALNNDKIMKTILKPEKDSYIILGEVSLANKGDKEVIEIKHTKSVADGPDAYHIQINKEKGTYKTTKIAPVVSPNKVQAMTTYYYSWVKLVTDDFVGWDCCSTKSELHWIDYGSTVGYNYANIYTWAANPTPSGTTWYLNYDNFPMAFLNSDHTKLTQNADAHFYNWDWMYDHLITVVDHYITIYAHSNDTWSYVSRWERSGEDYLLLDLDVYTS